MNKRKLILRGVSALLLLCMALTACNKSSDQSSSTSASDTVQQEAISDQHIVLSDGYKLIRPDIANDNVVDVFKILHGELSALSGTVFPSDNDWVERGKTPPQNNKEILLGVTNRDDSASVYAQLEDRQYRVCVTEYHVVIVGKDDLALYHAVNAFLDHVKTDGNGQVYIPRDLELTDRYTLQDNSALIPKIKPDAEVQLLTSSSDGTTKTPDWVNDLIIVEANIANVSGTLENAKTQIVDHLAEMGVNGLWLTPIGDRSSVHFYGNKGLHTIDDGITGTSDYEEGWKRFADFVAYAHSKNIRVFMDVVTWGTASDSPLVTEHPDWYTGQSSEWNGPAFDWNNAELRKWFADTCVDIVMKTGVDGIRCDCEPQYTGYDLYGEIRNRLLEQGRKIIIFSEHSNTRDGTYDFEQFGVADWSSVSFSDHQDKKKNWLLDTSIIAAVKQSDPVGANIKEIRNKSAYYRYFTYCVSCHDFKGTAVHNNILTIAYQAILAPFVPIWYIGEEFGWKAGGSLLYSTMDWSQKNDFDNMIFMEELKQIIAIRRTYSDVFSQFAANNREANIVAVQMTGLGDTAAYARYNANRAVLVIPNTKKGSESGNVTIPFQAMGLDPSKTYTVKNLMTGEVVASGKGSKIEKITVSVAFEKLGLYAVERS